MEDAKELILDDLDQEAEARKKLDALLEQLRVLRDAVTRWPVPADPS